MRRARFFVGRILLLPFALAGAVATLAGLLWLVLLIAPGLLLNNQTFVVARWALDKFNIEMQWRQAALEVTSGSLTRKNLHVQLRAFCYRDASSSVCFDNIDMNTEIGLNPFKFGVRQFGPAELLGGDIDWHLSQTDESVESMNFHALLEQLQAIKIAPFQIDIRSWQVHSPPDAHYSGRARLHARKDDSEMPWTIGLSVSELAGLPITSMMMDASIANEDGQSLRQASITATLRAQLLEQGQVSLSLDMTPKDQNTSVVDVDARYAVKQKQVSLHSRATLTPTHLNGDFSVNTINFLASGVKADLNKCQFRIAAQTEQLQNFDLNSDCRGTVGRPAFANETRVGKLLPTEFSFVTNIQAKLYTENDQSKFLSDVKLDLDAQKTEVLAYGGNMSGHFAGPLGGDRDSMRADIDFDIAADIKQFALLVQELNHTSWAIPAPFNVLNGPVSCGFSGRFATDKHKALLPVKCRTDLRSSEQELVTNVQGTLEMNTHGDVNPRLVAEVNLQRVKLVLPDINITRPLPTITRDRRIVLPGQEDQQGVSLAYLVHVRTPKPLQLVTNLSDQPVPIIMNLFLDSDKSLQGVINIANYHAELFRRTAKVERLSLRYAPTLQAPSLDGSIVVDTVDYRIRMLVLGTLERPRLSLESEPPLPERDIMAVLLFGRLPDGLEADQTRSAEETRAAVADGAISLLSMYYLASTPIESMSYNPHTGMYSAKVSLAKGFSLTLGSNLETESQLGLRKRLGRNWTAESLAIKDEVNETTKGVAMFTWSKRY